MELFRVSKTWHRTKCYVFCQHGLCFGFYIRTLSNHGAAKKVLVCLGENCREVMFSGNTKDLLGVVEVLSDTLSAQGCPQVS